MSAVTLADAIKSRRPVKFTYNKPGKSQGFRIGNPHAIFIFESKAGAKTIKVHIAQTDGVSDSGAPFPSFRMFDVDDIIVQSILMDTPIFDPHPDYNPTWPGYSEVIEKI